MNKEQIKQIRKTLNLTQTEFANLIGYSRQHISFVERGGIRKVGKKLVTALKQLNIN